MKTISKLVFAIFSGIALSTAVYAHDPSEHTGQGEKPDCGAMQNMDQGQMGMSDPVMQAMLKKCGNGMHSDAMGHEHGAQGQETDHHELSGEHDADSGHDQ